MGLQRLHVGHEALHGRGIAEHVAVDQARTVPPSHGAEIEIVVLGMILHTPEGAACVRERGCLQSHVVRRERLGAAGQRLDVVAMHGRRLEYLRLLGKKRMRSARRCQLYSTPEAELAATRIGPDCTAGRGHGDLQSPAAAEDRNASLKNLPHELDLAHDRRAAIRNAERRARDRRAIVALEPRALRQRCVFIRRIDDIT